MQVLFDREVGPNIYSSELSPHDHNVYIFHEDICSYILLVIEDGNNGYRFTWFSTNECMGYGVFTSYQEALDFAIENLEKDKSMYYAFDTEEDHDEDTKMCNKILSLGLHA